MAKTSPAYDVPLRDRLEKLASYEPFDMPVVSLYLNLASDQHGRDNYDAFVRKAFADHLKAFKESSAEHASLERDKSRITEYLRDVDRSSNGLALFASAGGGEFFEAITLDAPLDDHWFVVGSVPHLYPLARVVDQYPRYAAVLLNSNQARILVFGLGAVERREKITGEKTNRSAVGGWSQARYQRRTDNVHLLHVKEVVATLERIVRDDRIPQIIVAGDSQIVPLLKDQLPPDLLEKVVDVGSLTFAAGEGQILQATLEGLRQKDAETDAERVEELMGAWRGQALGVVGPEATMAALQQGKVDELLITGSPDHLQTVRLPDDAAPGHVSAQTSSPAVPDNTQLKFADELVTRAHQTGARVRFIEDASLLEEVGGVGALLRYR